MHLALSGMRTPRLIVIFGFGICEHPTLGISMDLTLRQCSPGNERPHHCAIPYAWLSVKPTGRMNVSYVLCGSDWPWLEGDDAFAIKRLSLFASFEWLPSAKQ